MVTKEQVKGEEAMELFKLVKANNLLPGKLDDLVPLSFIGSAAVRYYRDVIGLMDQLGIAESQRKATLRDGQDAGELLLDIEERIGNLLPSVPEVRKMIGKTQKGIPIAQRKGGSGPDYPAGINEKKAHQARTIARHPEIVAKVKAQARENEDIPTKTAVLNAISYEKEKARRESAEKGKSETMSLATVEQATYLNALDRCISILPQKPPKYWSEGTLKEATIKARIIIKRLEVFNGEKS